MWLVTPRGRRDALPRQLREEGEEAGKEGYIQSSAEGGKGRQIQGGEGEGCSSSRASSFTRVRSKLSSLELVGSVAWGHF